LNYRHGEFDRQPHILAAHIEFLVTTATVLGRMRSRIIGLSILLPFGGGAALDTPRVDLEEIRLQSLISPSALKKTGVPS
jgi:hypothetical protein